MEKRKILSDEQMQEAIRKLEDPDDDVSWDAARGAAKLMDERTIDPLIAALKDRDSEVRHWAVQALGRMGLDGMKIPQAVEPLISVLDNPEWFPRFGAAFALAELKNIRAVDSLIRVLESDPDPRVNSWAAYALVLCKVNSC